MNYLPVVNTGWFAKINELNLNSTYRFYVAMNTFLTVERGENTFKSYLSYAQAGEAIATLLQSKNNHALFDFLRKTDADKLDIFFTVDAKNRRIYLHGKKTISLKLGATVGNSVTIELLQLRTLKAFNSSYYTSTFSNRERIVSRAKIQEEKGVSPAAQKQYEKASCNTLTKETNIRLINSNLPQPEEQEPLFERIINGQKYYGYQMPNTYSNSNRNIVTKNKKLNKIIAKAVNYGDDDAKLATKKTKFFVDSNLMNNGKELRTGLYSIKSMVKGNTNFYVDVYQQQIKPTKFVSE